MLGLMTFSSASVYVSAINFDAPGNDHNNLNGEWVQISNSGATSVMMGGWTLNDDGMKHVYEFPQSFTLGPGASVTVYTGCGSNSGDRLYWCQSQAVWNNNGDVATLMDGQGNIVDQRSR